MSLSGFATRVAIASLAALPLSLRRALGHYGGIIFSKLPTTDQKIAALQLDRFIPELGGRKLLSAVYSSVGQTTMESVNLEPILANLDRYVDFNDWQLVRSLTDKTRPLLVLTAHTGNWDLMAAYFIKNGVDITTIGRKAQNAELQKILVQLREKYGVKTIWRETGKGAPEIIDVFKQNGVMAALIDQDTSVTSLFVPFFGEPARCPSTLIGIAHKHGARICTAFCARLPSGKYTVRVKELAHGPTVEETLAEYQLRLESHIREFPAQWVWFHKRWRSLHDGRRLSSREYIEYLSKGGQQYAHS